MNHGWGVVAGLLFFPFTAILHHAVFYSPQCILNPYGPEYTHETLRALIATDPSLALGAALALATWRIGIRFRAMQTFALAFLVAFAPLTIWLWDIPFTARAICRHFHDGQYGLRSAYFYALGAALFLPLLWLIKRRRSLRHARAQGAAPEL